MLNCQHSRLRCASRRTRLPPPLCVHSVWLDTTGREIVVRRPVEFDEIGWPCLTDEKMRVEKDQVGAQVPTGRADTWQGGWMVLCC